MSSRFRAGPPWPFVGRRLFCAVGFDGKCSKGNRFDAPSSSPSPQKVNFNPSCITAAASRTNQRIAGRHIGCGAPAAKRAGRSHVIGSTRGASIAIRCAVWIRDNGVIEQIEDLGSERSVVPLLESEGLEYRKIHVLEAGVANRFRPIVPKVPCLGGTITELPDTKQPPLLSVLRSGATFVHC
jgi:hypothetical protein